MSRGNLVAVFLLGAIALTGGLALSVAAHGRDALTLRVNDAIGEPGGIVAVVVRTYASRPIGQGQICLVAGPSTLVRSGNLVPEVPFEALVDSVVLASRHDGISLASMAASDQGQEILLQFSSSSGTINIADGPLGVLYFRLRDDIRPGQLFHLAIDPGNTALFDPAGTPVPVELRAGELEVRADNREFKMAVSTHKVRPGGLEDAEVESFEPFAIASGRIAILYDEKIAARRVRVRMPRAHGSRRFRVNRTVPGQLLVTFKSPKGDLNLVPGSLISVEIPTRSDIPLGTRSRIEIDSAQSFLFGPDGDLLPAEFEGDGFRFRRNGSGDDSDSDTDGDSDEDLDGDTDGDSDGDSDSEEDSDGDSDDDSEDDSDGDSEEDSDGDTEGDSDGEDDSDADSEDDSEDDESEDDSEDDSDADSEEGDG